LDELYKTPEWRRLSVQQKFWVQSYLAASGGSEGSSDDQVFATHAAYNAEGDSARAFSYKIVKAKKVQAALNRYFCKSPRQILIEQLQADITASKPGGTARVEAQKTLAQVITGGKLPSKKRGARK
jgi:hypothetical protein